jgi:transcription-repair coupling factor (superfamily II helicase)
MVKVFGGIPEGYIPFVLNHLCRDENKASLFITTGNEQTQQLEQQLKSLKPTFKIYTLLNWDCLPYDRVGPSQDVVEERINTFLNLKDEEEGFLLILSVKAYIQKVAPLNYWHDKQKKIQIGERFGREELIKLLISFGYKRCDTVYQQGDFSVRGHLVDVFLTATEQPFRIDFFDKEIETLRPFDIDTQTTYPKEQWVESILIKPASEVFWNPKFLDLFEKRYKALEGDVDIEEDAFFEAIMSGKIFQGHEHFSPLSFNEAFVPIEAYAKGKPINLYCDYRVPPLFEDQKNLIVDYYKARLNPYAGEQSFKPLPPDELYRFDTFSASSFSPFVEKDEHDFGARILSDFPTFEHNPNFLEEVSAYINDKLKRKKIYFAHTSEGIKDRIFDLLQIQDHPHLEILIAPFQKGFMAKDFILITDQDVLGERNRSSKIKKRTINAFLKN